MKASDQSLQGTVVYVVTVDVLCAVTENEATLLEEGMVPLIEGGQERQSEARRVLVYLKVIGFYGTARMVVGCSGVQDQTSRLLLNEDHLLES
jgi:hypothetical protein